MGVNHTSGKCIVFCDDDLEILDILKNAGVEMGHDVFAFSNAHELIDSIGRIQPDLIVTDIRMPELNGFQLIEALRRSGVIVPFIFLTGEPSMANYRRGFLDGHFDFLGKPFRYENLEVAIRKALAFEARYETGSKLTELIRANLQAAMGEGA